VADHVVTDPGNPAFALREKSRGETADLNDFAVFKLAPGRKYHLVARREDRLAESEVTVKDPGDQLVTLTLAAPQPVAPKTNQASPDLIKPLPEPEAARLKEALTQYFTADAARQSNGSFPAQAEQYLRDNEAAVREIAWEVYRQAPLHADLKADFDAQVVKFKEHVSPYTVKRVGKRPAKGWALFIAMHGGGGAPKQVNDSQWKHMHVYYRDHPEVGGYLYLALRAPNDTWNGFYDTYVYPLIDRLIRQFRLFGDIDPDRVFILGYSRGGYGAYAIGPMMPDRFAAIHASAAAATDGETTARTLRTTPFTAMVGETDTMYGRYERNLRFKEQVEKLRSRRTDIYPVKVTFLNGQGYRGLPDRDKIVDLYPAVRNPVPRELDWLMTHSVVRDFFWLRVPQPAKQQEILASSQNNRPVFTANEKLTEATVFMDTRLVDFRRPVEVELNGSTTTHRFVPSLRTFCEPTLARRADPSFAFCAAFSVVKNANSGQLELVFPKP
jgi:predicted esterase